MMGIVVNIAEKVIAAVKIKRATVSQSSLVLNFLLPLSNCWIAAIFCKAKSAKSRHINPLRLPLDKELDPEHRLR
jgi:hypothetical protein